LTVAEEKKLKGSFIMPDKISEHVAQCIYDCLIEKPSHVKTFEQFIKATTTHDRQALLFGLFHISFGEVTDISVKCSNPMCSKVYKYAFATDSLAHITEYEPRIIKTKQKDAEGKEVETETLESILTRLVEIDLPISKYKVFVKQPTIYDEIVSTGVTGQLPYQKDAIDDIILIDRFELNKKQFTEVGQKLGIYLALPSKDKRLIAKSYADVFAKYTIDVAGTAVCPTCKADTKISIDFMDNFFRMVLE
jgi:hypothetical protein